MSWEDILKEEFNVGILKNYFPKGYFVENPNKAILLAKTPHLSEILEIFTMFREKLKEEDGVMATYDRAIRLLTEIKEAFE